jgi:uncharacterized membrane protein
MTLLVVGLVLFLGVHSSRFLAADFRARQIAARGEGTWKAVYSIASAVGLVLVVYGYGQTRRAPVDLWTPPHFLYPVTSLLMVVAFVLITAAYVRGNHIKARLGHPMTLGVKTWAFAHLLSNGRLGDVVLFGAFLAWAVATYIHARKRDRAAGTVYPVGAVSKDVITVVVGIVVAAVFAKWLHAPLIGVQPF